MRLHPRWMSANDSCILVNPPAYKDFLRDAFRSKNKSVRKNLQGLDRYKSSSLFTDSSLAQLMDKKAFQVSSDEYIRLFRSFFSLSPQSQ